MNKVGDRICVNPLPGLDINGNEYDIIGSGGTITKIDGNEFIVEMFDGPILRVEAGDYDEVSQIKVEFHLKGSEKMIKYFELGFGYKEDEGFGTGDYEEAYSMAIKADHYPSFEEAEEFVADDMKKWGYTGINSITEIEEWEVHKFFDDDNVDNWKVLTNKS